jgi:hypothetical protein
VNRFLATKGKKPEERFFLISEVKVLVLAKVFSFSFEINYFLIGLDVDKTHTYTAA